MDGEATEPMIRPIGQVQVWGTVLDQDASETADPATYGDPGANPGFSLARARVGIEGEIPGTTALSKKNHVDYRMMVGVSPAYDVPEAATFGESSDLGIVDAWLRWTIATGAGPTQIAAGLMKVPFNRETMMSSTDLIFQERAVGGQWTSAGYDTGALAAQAITFGDKEQPRLVKLSAGVFNGEPGAILGNAVPGLMEVGRLEFELGDAYKTWNVDGDPAFGAGFAARNESEPATNTFTWNGDLLARVWYVCLQAELSQQAISLGDTTTVPPGVEADTNRRGAMGQLSFFIPIRKQSGVEIGGRYALFDDDLANVTTGDVQILHAGATWRSALPGVDLGAGYIHRSEPAEAGAWENDTLRVWTQIRPRYPK